VGGIAHASAFIWTKPSTRASVAPVEEVIQVIPIRICGEGRVGIRLIYDSCHRPHGTGWLFWRSILRGHGGEFPDGAGGGMVMAIESNDAPVIGGGVLESRWRIMACGLVGLYLWRWRGIAKVYVIG